MKKYILFSLFAAASLLSAPTLQAQNVKTKTQTQTKSKTMSHEEIQKKAQEKKANRNTPQLTQQQINDANAKAAKVANSQKVAKEGLDKKSVSTNNKKKK